MVISINYGLVMPESNSFKLTKLTAQINEFKPSIVKFEELNLSEDNQDKLFEGCPEKNSIIARKAFLEYLSGIANKSSFASLPLALKSDGTIKLEELLGEEGLLLYHNAIEEERNSREFRKAVLCYATTAYDGPKWQERLIMWIGGPSASGKTHGAKQLIGQESKLIPKVTGSTIDDKNYVVAIDGGVERDISQMRHILLDVALKKDYQNGQECVGISNLHKHTKLKCKGHIKRAVMHQHDLNMVIPATFSSGFAPLLSILSEISNTKKVRPVFARLTGSKILIKKVQHQGNLRAWLNSDSRKKLQESYDLNADNLCESKTYESQFFQIGVKMSLLAQKAFVQKMGNADNVRKLVHSYIPDGLKLTNKEKVDDLKFQYLRIVERTADRAKVENKKYNTNVKWSIADNDLKDIEVIRKQLYELYKGSQIEKDKKYIHGLQRIITQDLKNLTNSHQGLVFTSKVEQARQAVNEVPPISIGTHRFKVQPKKS